jgi:flagellar hook-associated protein 3 FlgL
MVSSYFRITPQMTARHTMANLQQQINKLDKLQSEESSQKALTKPSDNPVAMVAALHYRADVARNTQIGRNIDDATTWLNLADSTLNSVTTQLQRVRDLTVQAANATSDASSRQAIATEIDNIRGTLIGLANTKNLDRPIFGGNTSGAAAYDANGNYLGQSAVVQRTIAPGVQMQVNVNGDEVFGSGANDIFSTLSKISDDVRNNPTALGADQTALDAQTKTIQNTLASVGAREQSLQALQAQNSTDGLTLKQSLSQVEDVDLAQTTMDLNMQQVAYQAALQTTAKVIQPTLVDFLK